MSKSVIGGKARRAETGRTCFGYVCCAVLSASLLIMAGCSDPVKPPDSKIDARLILEDGYAWVYQVEDGIFGISQGGFIFKKDGTCIMLAYMSNKWLPTEVKWLVDGDKLSIQDGYSVDCDNNGCTTEYDYSEYTYSFSDGKLILDDGDETMVLIKTPVEISIIGGEIDPAVADKDWINEETGDKWQFKYFEEENMGVAIFTSGDGELLDMYYCSTSSGQLILAGIMGSVDVTYPYSISGNELTVNGVTYVLYEDDDDDWGMFKSRAKNELGKVSRGLK
jgi:hypothetical protein